MSSNELTGGCLCGAIRYRVEGTPFDADYCHCRQCQRSVGAPFGCWMDFKLEAVQWLGAQPKEYASSEFVRRGFCPECGAAMSFRDTRHPDYLTLTIASLDQPEQVSPRYHIHTDSAPSWLRIDDNLPRYPGNRNETS
ncbi:GFA family protein [Ferrimonas marina]|uniref:Uncharacterized conserved protein n=1 Tax=Ferrimonas marina TaxID=299255 RepID=A0A1M5NZR0_9GAMM|nr:GFA family protein [Ferrimonas marina]SHG94945.1 Uncharacterized conserved protein [Ferrimonas marina]